MDFPTHLSFTLTNACNLRCEMCGQWSRDGYVRNGTGYDGLPLELGDWQRLASEAVAGGIRSVILRGGEVFLLPWLVPLLEHLRSLGMFVSIDTNGTRLADHAADLVRLGGIHVTVSVDGPEPVHDAVRGVPGCFARVAAGLSRLALLDVDHRVSRSICFTISPWSVAGLGEMPAVARRLGVPSICIVPYCYLPAAAGAEWQGQIQELLARDAFSWRGFSHESSGVDVAVFASQHERFLATLGGLSSYPYLPLSPDEFRTWFSDPAAPVGRRDCANVERLIDIQPTGEANFCVDLPDGSLGNVRERTIAAIWNDEPARRFRARRRQGPLAACARCVARHMGAVRDDAGWPVDWPQPSCP
jgi:MoaA/NifB/PqqE/SkfB family radical SAM enzyme